MLYTIGLYENPTGSVYNTISSPGAKVLDKRSSYTPYPPTDSGTTINQERRQMFR
jgi:hypothetical protein